MAIVVFVKLTPVSEWPTRKLPQATFDAMVRTSMNQISTMVGQLNDFIVKFNANITQIQTDLATNATNATKAQNAANAAAASQTAAATSASNAKASETAAKASQTAAKTSETNAKTSETNAKASETKAKTSETNAASSATSADASKTAAATSASQSATSAANAAKSEAAAKASEISAAASKNAAKASEDAANASEISARESAEAAKSDAAITGANNRQSQALLAEAKESNLDAREIMAATRKTAENVVRLAGNTERDASDAKIWAHFAHAAQQGCTAERLRVMELGSEVEKYHFASQSFMESISSDVADTQAAATDARMMMLLTKAIYQAVIAERTRISELAAGI